MKDFLAIETILEYLKLFPLHKKKSGRPSKMSDKWFLNRRIVKNGLRA